jgi:hypothetical protein
VIHFNDSDWTAIQNGGTALFFGLFAIGCVASYFGG